MGLGLAKLRKFAADESGIAIILVAILLPVIIGFALLVIDMSRAENLQNDTQRGADALALAGAAELDGKSDSWTRAQLAIATLVHNDTRFSDGGTVALASNGTVTTNATYSACRSSGNLSWCFLKSIPASDATAINNTNYAATAQETRFIQVKAAPQSFTTIFPASFVGGGNTMNIGSEAVAGFKSGVCDFTPVFMCNPYEMDATGHNTAGDITLAQAVSDRAARRRLIELRLVGNGAAYGPGNFGFLQPPDGVGHGAQALAETIATSTPKGCYQSDGVDTKTGQNTGPVQDAFNVRFGISASGNHFNSPEYGPAANVRKGAVPQSKGNQCPAYNKLTFNGTGNMGLPHDATTPYMGGRMGDGNWDFSTYWSTNFGTADYATDHPEWNTTKPTRYEVYRYEITRTPPLVGVASPGGEVGTPPSACQPPVTTVDRRLIYGAILNCNALEAAGYDLNGNSTDLPVEAFASFFITEPVPSASQDAPVRVELVDVTGRAGQGTLDSFLRDEVQLYR
jgi:hypothetical protein